MKKEERLGWEYWAAFIGLLVFIALMVGNCQGLIT